MADEKKEKKEEKPKILDDTETFKELVTFVLKTMHDYSFSVWTLNKIPASAVLGVFAGVGIYVALTRVSASNDALKEILLRQTRMLEKLTGTTSIA